MTATCWCARSARWPLYLCGVIGTFSLVRAFYFIRSVYHPLLTRFWGEGAAGSAIQLFQFSSAVRAEPVGEGRLRPSPGGRSCDRSGVAA
ncbi:hypothetical protein XFF6166_290018 [Xanthomonas citri pv. fuscans]|nr:hypothetical protein XFF6166_290018 [Xanthomonas citri pv. fuscans]SOO00527.1 hypothetical protein XFF6960_330017 [Xanthomonas citri pv. fuscans]SOO04121.1 hypothetical protein XFF7767_230010 [Xanthomonas citri pv. fuscans]SOO10125.1 hypothetical protein XFF6970_50006 [Xanthomonas citri pv. fuscans]SOO14836.1 hypothetical protein XFF7766_40015 [Xanthomonas citri pv. fuscans]